MELKKPVVAWESAGLRIIVWCEEGADNYIRNSRLGVAVHRTFNLHYGLEKSGLDKMGDKCWNHVAVEKWSPLAEMIAAVALTNDDVFPGWRDPNNWIIKEPKKVERIPMESQGPYR